MNQPVDRGCGRESAGEGMCGGHWPHALTSVATCAVLLTVAADVSPRARGCARFIRSLFCSLPALALLTGCQLPSAHRHFPVGLYGITRVDQLDLVRDAGFNTVAGPADRAFLDAAHERNLRVLAMPGTQAGPGFNATRARTFVARYDTHPALWAWYLADEPDMHQVAPMQVLRAHRCLQSAGARKPTFLTLFQGYESGWYGDLTDIVGVDRYPVNWLPLANVGQQLRLARLGCGPSRPLIAILQAFDWQAYPQVLKEDPARLRPPTEAELRCMTYMALAERANGLLYYTYAGGSWRMSEHPETWAALTSVVHEVHCRLPLFRATQVWWPKTARWQDRSRRFNEALQASVESVWLRVRRGNDAIPEGDYILAVNTTDQEHGYGVTVPYADDLFLPVLEESRELLVQDGQVTDRFAPYSVHVYGPLPAVPGFRPLTH